MGSVLSCMILRRRKWKIHDEHGLRFAEACGFYPYRHCLEAQGLHPDASGGYTSMVRDGLHAGYTALVMARYGLMLVNVNDMYIGASIMLYGEWSEDEVQVMTLNLRPNSTVVDVGANIGALTIPLARAVPQGRVVAFEPQRVVEQILSANVQLNALHVNRWCVQILIIIVLLMSVV